ncbi:Oidioi.mRNA.OKI2018_I69.chr1.g3779.t1.cds [Oikopleura dioica]|uniref:Oidioi.mRNA.OKI2018_I69.chr1.g3779.t1.cds n=1 Tax=Oikopleura dioica TaxID=34765 RepID=A0ABN7SZH3_OIKDI|nr:Oidioi.mRNA.OKI2018_I69.chr1.g3779.t1.cds [Oikopleura dioica]
MKKEVEKIIDAPEQQRRIDLLEMENQRLRDRLSMEESLKLMNKGSEVQRAAAFIHDAYGMFLHKECKSGMYKLNSLAVELRDGHKYHEDVKPQIRKKLATLVSEVRADVWLWKTYINEEASSNHQCIVCTTLGDLYDEKYSLFDPNNDDSYIY